MWSRGSFSRLVQGSPELADMRPETILEVASNSLPYKYAHIALTKGDGEMPLVTDINRA
jgi:hypothetical protein